MARPITRICAAGRCRPKDAARWAVKQRSRNVSGAMTGCTWRRAVLYPLSKCRLQPPPCANGKRPILTTALKHPNWEMGAKITIDSATLMNKGLEVIEAKWLFQLAPEQIDVIVHPQSIIHSIVQFTDGSMKAQMGLPDMKLPIQYALAYPERIPADFPRFNFLDYPQLTFEKADTETFLNLNLAYEAMKRGGNAACIINAANEITNRAFLEEKIGFLEIAEINSKCLESATFIEKPTLEDYMNSDEESRRLAANFVG